MDNYTSGLVSIDRHPGRATLRSFGLALALLCSARGVWSALHAQHAAVALCSGVVLAGVALARPTTYRAPYILLGTLTFPLRWIISYLVLAVVYFAVITPIAWGLRLTRSVNARETTSQSKWRASPPRGDKPSYFRQF